MSNIIEKNAVFSVISGQQNPATFKTKNKNREHREEKVEWQKLIT